MLDRDGLVQWRHDTQWHDRLEAAERKLARTTVIFSAQQKDGVINTFKLGGVEAHHFYGDDVRYFRKAFGSLIQKAYFVYPKDTKNEMLSYSGGMNNIRSLYLAIPYTDAFVDLEQNKIMNGYKYVTELGFHFEKSVGNWLSQWDKIAPTLKSFTFHGAVVESALKKICAPGFQQLKHLEIVIKPGKEALDLDPIGNQNVIVRAVKEILSKATLESFKSNIVDHEFYRYLKYLPSSKQLSGIGFDLTHGTFPEYDPTEKASFAFIKELWIKAPTGNSFNKYLPEIGCGVTQLTLDGFALDTKEARANTLAYVKKFKGLTHLSLFYMTGAKHISFVEDIVNNLRELLVIEMPCDTASSIHHIYRINRRPTTIIWLESHEEIEKALEDWYSMAVLQDDKVHKVIKIGLNEGYSPPSSIQYFAKSIKNFFF